MDFKLVIVVLFAYFIRPQDWMPGIAGTAIMKPLMAVTLIAMFTRRRGLSMSSLVKTPLDWAVLAYAIYLIAAAPAGQRPTSAVFIFVAYYFVTSQALSTPRRLAIYVRCWFFAIIVVAAMAVMSEYGLDLTGAKELTYKVPDQPRLALNTYLFDNANSLGHTVVIGIPLAYFVFFWKRRLSGRLLGIVLALLAGYCAYLTQSKGAYIVGFAVFVVSLIIGRRRIFQLIAILLAATIGWAGLSQLPRMTEMSSARKDEAMIGRMLAWEQARIVSKESATGEGFKNFKAMIEFDNEEIFKATHSSYVLVGAELGPNGMFFYLAVLYACLRVLLTSRCHSQQDERSRRAMFVLLLGYLLSSWLIDRSYHLEYFLLAGAISGFHRRLGVEAKIIDPEGELTEEDYGYDEEEKGAPEAIETAAEEPVFYPNSQRLPVKPYSGPPLAYLHQSYGSASVPAPTKSSAASLDDQTFTAVADVDTSQMVQQAIEEELTRRWFWRRFGILDLALVVVFSKVVFELWDYALKVYLE